MKTATAELEETARSEPRPAVLVMSGGELVAGHGGAFSAGWMALRAWVDGLAAVIPVPPPGPIELNLPEHGRVRVRPGEMTGARTAVHIDAPSDAFEMAHPAPLAMLVVDARARVMSIDAACCALFRLDRAPESLVGIDAAGVEGAIAAWFHADEAARLAAGEATAVGPRVARTRDERVVLWWRLPLVGASGAAGHVWLFRDETQVLRAAAARRARVVGLEAMMQSSPDLMWSVDRRLRLVLFNERFATGLENAYGWRPMPGLPILDFGLAAQQRDWWQVLYTQALAGETASALLGEATPGWRGRAFDVTMCPIRVEGRVVGAAGYMRDLTETRTRAAQLERANAVLDALTELQARFIDEAEGHSPFVELLAVLMRLTGSGYGLFARDLDEGGERAMLRTHVTSAGITVDGEVAVARVEAAVAAFGALEGAGFDGEALEEVLDVLDPDHPPLSEAIALPCYSARRLVGLFVLGGRPTAYTRESLDDLEPLLQASARLLDALRSERRRRAAEEALKEAKESAEAANRAKGDFLASMSHEIRTPLNAAIGLTELALDAAVSDDQRSLLEAATANSETLLRLISDVLDFSRIEAGRVDLDEGPFDLRRLVEEVVELMAVRAAESGVELVADVAPRLPAPLVGDAHRLRQIVTNLVSNGIKFTEDGEVVASVRTVELDDERVQVSLVVRDTGCGIAADEQAHVFERFHRAAATAGESGTGLGLAIVRSLVEAMGGAVTVSSTPGEGSAFRVELPLTVSGVAVDDGSPVDLLSGVTVMVVHPPGPTVRWMRATLEAAGADVRAAADGGEAAAAGGDGADVFLTVEPLAGVEGEQVRLDRVGALDRRGGGARLALPTRRDALLKAVLAAAGRRTLVSSPPLRPRPAQAAPRHVLLVEDHDDNREVARRLIMGHGHTVETAANGEAALARLRESVFDLVLMDLHMPRLGGLETTRRLRADEGRTQVAPTPVVAVTGHATAEIKQQCLAEGFDGFVAKPVTGQVLSDAIERFGRSTPIALVVDDAADSRRLLIRYLRRFTSLRVRQAPDAEQALLRASEAAPTLVFIDAVLPGMDGFGLARALRARLGPSVALVMVTGRTGGAARRAAEEAGCDGFLQKPVRREGLIAMVDAQLSALGEHAGADDGAAATAGEAATGDDETLEPAPVVCIDPDLLDLIPPFLDDRREDIAALDAAIEAGDFSVIKRLGHSMKGTGSAYGMVPVSVIGARLEDAARAADRAEARAVRDALASFVERVVVVADET